MTEKIETPKAMAERLRHLEIEIKKLKIEIAKREVERLKVKELPIMSNYLLTTGKAADSDKLDGQLASYYALATHDHDGVYVPMNNFAGYTGTIVGWSGTPAVQLTYAVIGKLLLMSVYIQGTSDSTTASVTIPPGLTSASQGVPQTLPVRVRDNGVLMQTPGMAVLENNGTVIQFYLNYGSEGFTASGTKRVTGNFAWIIA